MLDSSVTILAAREGAAENVLPQKDWAATISLGWVLEGIRLEV